MGIKSIALVALVLSNSVNAATVQPEDIVFTSGDGTNWLSLSLTVGSSLSEALTAYDGYTIATKNQFDDMYSSFTPTASPTQTSGIYEVYSGIPSQALSFQQTFGITGVDDNAPYTHEYSYGFYADNSGTLDSSSILMGGVRHSTNSEDASYENTYFWHDTLFTSGINVSGHQQYSYYLVNETVVPVPAAIWLFGSGLLGLIGMARRKTNV